MMKILSIFLLIIGFQRTNSGLTYVFYSQITDVIPSYLPLSQQYYPGTKRVSDCTGCRLCMYMSLYGRQYSPELYYTEIADSSKLAPAVPGGVYYKKVNIDFYKTDTMRIIVKNCDSPYTFLDRYISTYVDSSFFIKCTNCIGVFAGYKMKGTISVSETTISNYKTMKVEITRIKFIHRNVNKNRFCVNNFPRVPGEDPDCEYKLYMKFNGHMYWDFQNPYYNTLQKYDLTHPAYANITPIFTKPVLFDCDVLEHYFEEYIDIMPQMSFAALPYHKSKFVTLGTYGNVEITFEFSYLSFGYAGGNSDFPSSSVEPGTYVDVDGRVRCADARYKQFPCDSRNDISICAKGNPCKNGAICKGTLTAYECFCSPGLFGKNCEFFFCKDPCVNRKCINMNKCGDCDPGWSGPDCKTISCNKYNDCIHGSCNIENGNRTCICNEGYNGRFCNFKCDFHCIHGYCEIANGISFCFCSQGWFGPVCDRQSVNEQKIFPYSRNFAIAVALIIIFGILIIILAFIILTKCINRNVSFDVLNYDVNQYKSKTLTEPFLNTEGIAIVPSKNENVQREDNIYLGSTYDYSAANFQNNSSKENNIYDNEYQDVKKDNLVYDNPYNRAVEDETYVYNLAQRHDISTTKETDETVYLDNKLSKKGLKQKPVETRKDDNPYGNSFNTSSNDKNRTDGAYDNPYA